MYHNAATGGKSHGDGICTKKFVKISPAVPEICSQTDRHTDRQAD